MQRNPARLSARGPLDPGNGFPRWYKDGAGVRLGTGLRPRRPEHARGRRSARPGAPVGFPGNFPDESFYFLAEAEMPVGGRPVPAAPGIVLAMEAAFAGTGEVADGPAAGLRPASGCASTAGSRAPPTPSPTLTAQTDPLRGGRERAGLRHRGHRGGCPASSTPPVSRRRGGALPALERRRARRIPRRRRHRAHHRRQPARLRLLPTGGPAGRRGAGASPDPADPGQHQQDPHRRVHLQGRISTVAGRRGHPRRVHPATSGQLVVDVFAHSEPGQTLHAAGIDADRRGRRTTTRRAGVTDGPGHVELVNSHRRAADRDDRDGHRRRHDHRRRLRPRAAPAHRRGASRPTWTRRPDADGLRDRRADRGQAASSPSMRRPTHRGDLLAGRRGRPARSGLRPRHGPRPARGGGRPRPGRRGGGDRHPGRERQPRRRPDLRLGPDGRRRRSC